MPLVKKDISLANGATSANILANTNYEFIGPNVPVIISCAADSIGTPNADGTSGTFLNATVNNTELTSQGSVSALVTGQPFGYNNTSYQMNNFTTGPNVRNRLNVQFNNASGASRDISVAIFIGT